MINNEEKELKKKQRKAEYDKRSKTINLRFSYEQRVLLKAMMRIQGWENMSGFIKYTLFKDNEMSQFIRAIAPNNPQKKENRTIALEELVENLYQEISYGNYMFRNSKILMEDVIENPDLAKKYKAQVERFERNYFIRTGQILERLEKVSKALDLEIRKYDPEELKHKSMEELEVIALIPGNEKTPEALEYGLRLAGIKH